jgi:hypothetical protein
MKRKTIILSLVALATTSLYAFGGFGGNGCQDNMKNMPNQKMMQKRYMKQDSKGMRSIMSALSSMDLSKKQWLEIKKSMLDMKKERLDNKYNSSMSITFKSDGTFDKEKFIKEHTNLSNNMIETKSKAIENIVSILDESQRKILASKLSR